MSFRFAEDLSGADRGFRAEGDSLFELLRSAVDATLAVMVGDPAAVRPERRVRARLEAADPAGLLFALLEEVIYRKDAEGLFLRLADGEVTERGGSLVLEAALAGEAFDRSRHEAGTDVKAVTLYGFEMRKGESGGWQASVVLDV